MVSLPCQPSRTQGWHWFCVYWRHPQVKWFHSHHSADIRLFWLEGLEGLSGRCNGNCNFDFTVCKRGCASHWQGAACIPSACPPINIEIHVSQIFNVIQLSRIWTLQRTWIIEFSFFSFSVFCTLHLMFPVIPSGRFPSPFAGHFSLAWF